MMNTTSFAGRALLFLLLLAALSMVDAFVVIALAPHPPAATITVPHTTTTTQQQHQPLLSLHATTSMLIDTITPPRRHRRIIMATTSLKVTTNNVDDDEEFVVTDGDYYQQTDNNPIQQFVRRFLAAGGEYDEKEIGERGEMYFFLQAVPIVGIALGGIPIVSDALRFVAGPGLLLVGIIIMALTALDMGDALTPWPKPNGEGLVTTGLYGQVRHPMYAGLLSSLVGFSVWTQSIDRLLLVALLVVALDIKSDYEEGELTKAYPDYPQYQEKVTSKFVPRSLLEMRKPKQE